MSIFELADLASSDLPRNELPLINSKLFGREFIILELMDEQAQPLIVSFNYLIL